MRKLRSLATLGVVLFAALSCEKLSGVDDLHVVDGKAGSTAAGGASGNAGRAGAGGGQAGRAGAGGAGAGGSSTGGSSGSSGGNAGGQGGSVVNSGDCGEGMPACDASFGERCVELTPGGFRACIEEPWYAEGCTGSPGEECCYTSPDCGAGKVCGAGPVMGYCDPFPIEEGNRCVADECTQDSDCTRLGEFAICAPAGAFGYPARRCTAGGCRTDADCTARGDGSCATISPSCCGAPIGLYCYYGVQQGGCRQDFDCGDGYCVIDGNEGRCSPTPPECPEFSRLSK